MELLKGSSPKVLQRQQWYLQVLPILLPELKGWLVSWQIGQSLDAVYLEAQHCLYGHLRNLTPEQTAWMETLLADKEQAQPDEPQGVRADVVSLLAQIFTPDDWQAIANAAAQTMANDILQIGQGSAIPVASL